MFRRIARYSKQYWLVLVLILVGVLGAVLQLTDHHTLSHWWLGICAVLLTTPACVDAYDRFRTGDYGMNILGIVTVMASVLLHEYWFALAAVALLLLQYLVRRRVLAVTPIHQYDSLKTQMAHVLRGRKAVDMATSQVQPGDKLVINANEIVPVDGLILEGESTFDETAVNSETNALSRKPNDLVLAGSTNLGEPVIIRASTHASDSQYRRLLQIKHSALKQPAPFVRLNDYFSLVFTVLALLIAGGTWTLTKQSIHFLEVLSVATVYPLLVAVPLAFQQGLLRLHKRGVVVRTAGSFERLKDIQTLAFDIDGTLTSGTIQIDSIKAIKPFDRSEVISAAASLMQAGNSPFAPALITKAASEGVALGRIKHAITLPANGWQATIKNNIVAVGPYEAIHELTIKELAAPKDVKGIVLFVVINKVVAGEIVLRDELRPEVPTAFDRLRSFGIQPLLLTKHEVSYAQSFGNSLGVSDIQAGQTPASKLKTLDTLAERPVAYVGDVTHDSSLLTAADMGIGLGVRDGFAHSSAATVLILRDSFASLTQAIQLARRVVRIAKTVIVVSLMLNLLLMLAFAYAHWSPYIGLAIQLVISLAATLYVYRVRFNTDKH